MKPFSYERASTPAQAAAAVARNANAKFIAGGTNLLDLMKLQIEAPAHLIDVNGLALDNSEGERIAFAMDGADVAFLGNHGVVVCGARMDHAYDDLYYLERGCQLQVIAASTGRALLPADQGLARRVCEQTLGERLQSELFFEALRRRG